MWHLQGNRRSFCIPRLAYTYWVGRKKNLCKIRITGDRSISRKHCRIIVTRKAGKFSLMVEDCSKFGTFINDRKCPEGQEHRITTNENEVVRIRFGTELEFRLVYQTFSCSFTGYNSTESGHISRRIMDVGWTGLPSFRPDQSFLMLKTETLDIGDPKFALALCFGIPIVTEKFLIDTETRQKTPELDLKFPEITNYEPSSIPLSQLFRVPNTSISPNHLRRNLFKRFVFIFLDKIERNNWEFLITSTEGKVRDLSQIKNIEQKRNDIINEFFSPQSSRKPVYIEGLRDDNMNKRVLLSIGFEKNTLMSLTSSILSIDTSKFKIAKLRSIKKKKEKQQQIKKKEQINDQDVEVDDDDDEDDSTTDSEDEEEEDEEITTKKKKKKRSRKVLMESTLPTFRAAELDIPPTISDDDDNNDLDILNNEEKDDDDDDDDDDDNDKEIPPPPLHQSEEAIEKTKQRKKKKKYVTLSQTRFETPKKSEKDRKKTEVMDTYIIRYYNDKLIGSDEEEDEEVKKFGRISQNSYYEHSEEEKKRRKSYDDNNINLKKFRKQGIDVNNNNNQNNHNDNDDKNEENEGELELVEYVSSSKKSKRKKKKKKKKKRKKKKEIDEDEDEIEESDEDEDDDEEEDGISSSSSDDEALFNYQPVKRKVHPTKKTSRRKRRKR